jgi:hypothetical protein
MYMKLKCFETTFHDYIYKKNNLHSYLQPIYKGILDVDKNQISKNIIFYGPPGIGKYTQVLNYIKHYSKSNLKYERKLKFIKNKRDYIFKISDIHFEIDIELLGCNAKVLWNIIYYQIVEIISSRSNKYGIIVCKNFHKIHNELLDIFYSYMQSLIHKNIKIDYIFITEQISFIPQNILSRCSVISLKRPTKTSYNKCLKNKVPKDFDINEMTNIKQFKIKNYKINSIKDNVCNQIIKSIEDYENIDFLKFRDYIYNLFIYQLDINECIWKIMEYFIENKKINIENSKNILLKTYLFFKYFNNNYRPIYHLEKIFFYMCKEIYGL